MRFAGLAVGLALLGGCSRGVLVDDPDGTSEPGPTDRNATATAPTGDPPAGTPATVATPPPPDPQAEPPAPVVDERRLARLERRLRALESRLGGSGSGAYRSGSTLRLEGSGEATLLDHLHRLETELATAEQRSANQREQLATLRQRLLATKTLGDNLEEQLAILERVEDKNQTQLQELAEFRRKTNALQSELAASELARLRLEKAYFDLVTEVVTMRIDETQRLRALQQHLRTRSPDHRPGDLDPAVERSRP